MLDSNIVPMSKDIIYGDDNDKLLERFNKYTYEDIRKAIKLIVNNSELSEEKKHFFLNNSWKIFYKEKPPTMEEFLTPAWIGSTANNLFPHVRSTLCEFFHPLSEYRYAFLASCIGYGKSTWAAIAELFVLANILLMKNPKKFFGLAQSSTIVEVLVSFTLMKAKQLLLNPFKNIMEDSPKFKRIKLRDQLESKQKEYPNQICYTTASRIGGVLEFGNDFHILLSSDPSSLLGLSIISVVMSEISFFIDRGISPEVIWKTFTESKGRVISRFGTRYLSSVIVDSSPNDFELPLDNYIFSGKAETERDDNGIKRNYVITSNHWSVHPYNYPVWLETKKEFPLFRGSSGRVPKILHEEEIENFNKEDIVSVPIDIKQIFIDDIRKATRDYVGWPSGGLNKCLDDIEIINNVFTDRLLNIDTYIFASAEKQPEKLIWDQVKNKFFVKIGDKYEFYRYPNEKRYLHLDLAETGDLASLSMCHKEMYQGLEYIIGDFTINVCANKGRINLDAFYEFILDLHKEGRVYLGKITGDSWGPTKAYIQRLKRDEFEADVLSVDRDTAPYYSLFTYIKTGRFKVGKNYILKGNLKSLIEVKSEQRGGKIYKKIDHTKGHVSFDLNNMDWENSHLGINGKDCSDSVCGAFYNCITDSSYITSAIWETEEEAKIKIQTKLTNMMSERFGLKIKETA
jgi:hypothetical protein